MIFSDAVYGLIEIPDVLVKCVIDTPTFQRLRRIKQIGLGQLVYPSHDGTRFQHSLGASHLAVKALESLKRATERYVIPELSGEEKKDVEEVLKLAYDLKEWFRYFMLLHDVGHGPLSHNYEDAVYEASALWGLDAPKASWRKLHEAVSKKVALAYLHKDCGGKSLAELLCERAGEGARKACSEDPVAAVASLLEPRPGVWDEEVFQGVRSLFSFLSNGEIDVDRGDYLMRDATMAGTRVGLFDYERLYSVLVLVPSDKATPVEVAVLDKGVATVESMLLSRFYMYENVYLHKTVLLYSAIASRLMAWWLKEGKMPKAWELESLDGFDDCLFYSLLHKEEELLDLVRAVKFRDHSHLVREEIINATTEGELHSYLFPIYRIAVGSKTLAELMRDLPQLLAYGASVRPFGGGSINTFIRRSGEVVPLTSVSSIVSSLARVTHVKLYLAGPRGLAPLIKEVAEELRDIIRSSGHKERRVKA